MMKLCRWKGQCLRFCLALTVCFSSLGTGRAATNVVRANGPASFNFTPSVLNITVGDTVLWTNTSTTMHDVSEGTFAGGLTPTNSRYWAPINLISFVGKGSVTFSNTGSYPYICKIHVFDQPQPPGNPTQTGLVNVAAFNFPPTVDLTSSAGTDKLLEPASVTMTATASDQDGTVTNIQLFIGSNLVAQGTSSPLSATIGGLPGGNYILTAKAVDNQGSTNTSPPVNLVVNYRVDYFNTSFSPTTLKIKPGESVLFTNLGGAHTVSGTGTEPFCGSAPVPINSCQVTLNNAGVFPFQCVFHSAFGMTGAVSVAAFNRAPTVNLTSSSGGATLFAPATFTLHANALDPDGMVTSVRFQNGASPINTDSTPPFEFTVTNLAAGTYSFTALAVDSAGTRGTSAPVNITVVAPIQLSLPALGAGGFQFNYTASPGLRYVVEGSETADSPAPYVPLATNVAGGNVVTFVDPAALNRSNRMYRVFQQP